MYERFNNMADTIGRRARDEGIRHPAVRAVINVMNRAHSREAFGHYQQTLDEWVCGLPKVHAPAYRKLISHWINVAMAYGAEAAWERMSMQVKAEKALSLPRPAKAAKTLPTPRVEDNADIMAGVARYLEAGRDYGLRNPSVNRLLHTKSSYDLIRIPA
jgi:hypothetical protein